MTPLHPLGHNSNSSLGSWQCLFPASWSPRIKAAIWEPRKHEHSQTANPDLLFTREQWTQPKFWSPKSFQTLPKCQPSPFKNHSFLKQSFCLWRVGKKWLLVREFFSQIKSLQKTDRVGSTLKSPAKRNAAEEEIAARLTPLGMLL